MRARVYLAGKIFGVTYAEASDWRDDMRHELVIQSEGAIEVLDPMRDKDFNDLTAPLPRTTDQWIASSGAMRGLSFAVTYLSDHKSASS